MKVYRGYNKEIGPISYPDWIYVTQDLEQAKYYATRNGAVEDGAIIEYNMADDLKFISIDYVNKIMDNGDPYNQEYYTEEDLLWYQDGLTDYLYRYGAGIKFEDPEYKGHIIYILFGEKYLTNGRILSKEEFDAIQIKESAYENELNDVLKRAGVQLNEKVIPVNKELADTQLVTSAYELNEIIKNNKERRIVYDKKNNWFLVGDPETSIHSNLLSDALQDGYYQPFEWNGEMIDGSSDNDGGVLYDLHPNDFVLFRTSSDSLNGEDYYYDRYQYCYIYKDYCVFDRKLDFQETPLYKLLGEPIDIENNGNVLEDEGLNETKLDETIEYDSIRDIIFNKVMQSGEIEEGYVITDDDYDNYITYYAPEELVKKLIDESGYEETPELVEYVKNNYNTGVSLEVVKYIFNNLYERNRRNLEQELSVGNKIYRIISSNNDINYVIEQCKIHGIGNCWAKTKGNEHAYNGGGGKYDYDFEAEINEEDVDWKTTMYLRMVADYEDEIRLKKDAKINVLNVEVSEYFHNENGQLGGKKYKIIPLNIVLPVGSKYSY